MLKYDVLSTLKSDVVSTLKALKSYVVSTLKYDVVSTFKSDVVSTLNSAVVSTLKSDAVSTSTPNFLSTLKSDVETVLKMAWFPDVEINYVVLTLKICCSTSQPKINLKITFKQRDQYFTYDMKYKSTKHRYELK